MKKLLLLGTVLTFLFVSCEIHSPFEAVDQPETIDQRSSTFTGTNGDIIPGRYIVVFNEDNQHTPTEKARFVLERLGLSLPTVVDHVYSHTIKGFAGTIPSAKLDALKADPSVAYIEPDRIITLDTRDMKPTGEVSTRSAVQEVPWGILRVHDQKVPANVPTSGKRVWILDTGIDEDHPDLNVDVARGFTAFSRGPDSSPDDKHGHGTHVAGTVAAINNSIDVVGAAPGAVVVAVKVLDKRGSGSTSGVIAGIDYVTANAGAGDVANMSLGGGVSTSLDNAVKAAAATGIKFSLAAGNESDDANYHSPARVEATNVYTISAFDSDDNFASFSNYGNPPIEYGQPGVSILSLYKDGGRAIASGTSMAAPHFAGLLYLGSIGTDGLVFNDPDGDADTIAIFTGTIVGGNNPPTANFSFTTSELTASFTDASTDDGTIVKWDWTFGDGGTSTAQNPTHLYGTTGEYSVTLTVTDDEDATASTTQTVTVSTASTGEFALTAVGYKIRGVQHADITWENANSSVIIYRDGEQIGTGGTSGTLTDNINRKGGGSYTYEVCDDTECVTTVVTF